MPKKPSPREVVGAALIGRAAWVLERLEQARRLGVRLDEETITQTVLLDLRESLGVHVQVTEFSRAEESRTTGADWEWWFCDGVGQRLFGMRVQAKKLKMLRPGVPGYDFAYTPASERKKAVPTRQVDRLVAAAARDRLPAVYALYNGSELDLSVFTWGCCHAEDRALFGVSLIAADAAQRAADVGDTSLSAVGGMSRPWSCCALCPTRLRVDSSLPFWPEEPDFSLSLYAADLIAELHARGSEETDAETSIRLALMRAGQGFRDWAESPSYVRQLMELQDPRERQMDLLDVPPDLGGAVIFREA